MNNIIKRPFRILADFPSVRAFMLRVYERTWDNGVPAPFLEYALSASWADQTMTHRNAVWEDNGKIVAFCFYEAYPGTAFFNLDPDYGFLAGDMIKHAEQNLAEADGNLTLKLLSGQAAIAETAKELGYTMAYSYGELQFNLKNPLDYKLPDGYRFVEPENIDNAKVLLCCWKGFDHESEGEWDGNIDAGLRTALAPNATPQYYVVVEHTQSGEYVCYAGMWWTPENRLAYMEPLCTVPLHRRKGLAAAALSEMARRMRPLGTEWMTGGGDVFYHSIGYEKGIEWNAYQKNKED